MCTRLDSGAKNRCASVVQLATGRQAKPLKLHKMDQFLKLGLRGARRRKHGCKKALPYEGPGRESLNGPLSGGRTDRQRASPFL
jgi:hypothetical protein